MSNHPRFNFAGARGMTRYTSTVRFSASLPVWARRANSVQYRGLECDTDKQSYAVS